ncbi:MAG: two-component regulator propeller domain-containing protein [Cyclobacteriaceae bacterium]
MARVFPLFILLFTLTQLVEGQKHEITNYDVRNGLPQSQITGLLEDERGYIWIGTNGGLSYFDGVNFKAYTRTEGLLSNRVTSLASTREGSLLIGSARGVSIFNGKDFKNYQVGRVQKAIEFYDTIYCYNPGFELTKIYKDSIFEKVDTTGSAKVAGIYSNGYSEFFEVKTSGHLFIHDHEGVRQIRLPKDCFVHNLHFEGGETFAMTSLGVFNLSVSGAAQLIDSSITSPVALYDVDQRTAWFKFGSYLIQRTFNGSETSSDTISIGSPSSLMLKDREDVVWIGTQGDGLWKYQMSEFEKIGGVNTFVLSILRVEDEIWVGTEDSGLLIIANDRVKKRLNLNRAGSERINSLRHDKDGKVWIATNVGLACYDEGSITWFDKKNGLPGDSISDIEFDNQNRIWLTFRRLNVVGRFDGKMFINFASNDILNSTMYYEIVHDPQNDRMYFSSDNGVFYVEDEKLKRLDIPRFRRTKVYSIDLYEEDYLIMGSAAKGLAIYNTRTDSVKHYAREDGPTIIYFIGADDEGYAWMGSDIGVSRLRFDKEMNIEEYLNFGNVDKASVHQSNFRSYSLKSENKLIGLSDGLYRFVKTAQKRDQPLHFQNVQLFFGGEDLEKYADSMMGFFKIPGALRLPSDKNHLTFNFFKVNIRNPASVTYKYILEGFETRWNLPGRRTSVTYGNIPPGEYTFKVLTRDKSGLWLEKPLEFRFAIDLPFYKSTFFLAAIVFLGLGIIFLIAFARVKYQVRKALERETIRQEENTKLRKEIGRDFHDEMGNRLARIINYVGIARLNNTDAIQTLIKVEDSAKELISGTKDFIWALDPVNDSVYNLFAHVKDFGQKLFSDSGIQFRADYLIQEDLRLPPGFGRQVNLILKESMTNSYKHSRADWLDLSFKESGDRLIFEVRDNGIGTSKEMIEKSEGGIANMFYRAANIGGNLSLSNYRGKGTTIELIIQIKRVKA